MGSQIEKIKSVIAESIRVKTEILHNPEMIAKCEEIAGKIIKNSGMAIGSAIRSVNAGFVDGTNGFETEITEFGKCFGTEEFKEGTTAFLEKRKPVFN